jgi:hypothetical protein
MLLSRPNPEKRSDVKSEAQKREDRLYSLLKPQWHKDHPYCEALCRDHGLLTPSMNYPHHIRGRGKLQNEVRFWMAICRPCYDFIENKRAVARCRGWLASRDLKAIQQTLKRKK